MRLAPTLLVSVAALAAGAYLACHSSQADLPAATAPAPANSIQGSVLEVLPAGLSSWVTSCFFLRLAATGLRLSPEIRHRRPFTWFGKCH